MSNEKRIAWGKLACLFGFCRIRGPGAGIRLGLVADSMILPTTGTGARYTG
jgi:hypothetical protein